MNLFSTRCQVQKCDKILNSQVKITFLTHSLNHGGAERQLVTLVREFRSRSYNVLVAVFYPNGPLEEDLRDADVPVYSLDKRGRWDVFGFLFRLVGFLRKDKPDILHSYLVVPNIITVLLKPFFPNIRMVWGVRASNVDLYRYDWLTRLTYRIESMLSRFADLIIVNSHAGLNYAVKKGFPKKKMVVIPNGIDTERFYPDVDARQRVRIEWGIKENEKLIGLVARLDPMKDHPTFLKAAARLSHVRADVRFVCVGDGTSDYRKELHTLSKGLGLTNRLIWAGNREDMTAVYNALDIATSSSYGEGFPNVIGEAMACGVPCVVTNVGDSAWIVGDTGTVVSPKSPDSLESGWKVCLARDDKEIFQKTRKRIMENFSLNMLLMKTVKVLC
jgi:glycosyltransferase involved in cell wall biosynthesis